MKIIIIAYKPDSEDYCRGCHMASYGSDFIIETFTNAEEMITLVKEILNRKMRVNEVGYTITVIVNGTIIINGDSQEYLDETYDDSIEVIIRNKYYECVK